MASYTISGAELAAGLVNSDCARKGELLRNGAALTALLARHGWEETATDEDARQARELRPELRAVFTSLSLEEAVGRVNALLERSGCVPQLRPDDSGGLTYEFRPAGPLAQRVAGVAAGGLAESLRAGRFERMRTCADATCSDVFVDVSRNRSRRFCRPETCGNRNNVAAYRARRRLGSGPRSGQTQA